MAKTKSPTTSAPLPPLPPARIVQHLHWPIDDYRTVQRAAHAAGMPLNAYVRMAAMYAAERDADVEKHATAAIRSTVKAIRARRAK